MPLIIPAGYAQCILTHTASNVDGGDYVVTLGFGAPLGDDPTSLGVAAEIIATSWSAQMMPLTDAQVTFTGCTLNGPTSSAFAARAVGGGTPMDSPPPNVALLVKKVTTRRGRRAQGRMFLYGLIPGDQVDERGNVSSGRLAGIQSKLDTFLENVTTDLPANMVILQNSEGQSAPISPPPIVDQLQAQALAASQRRRLRR